MDQIQNSEPPGTSAVRNMPNRGSEWYCIEHRRFVQPVWIRKEKYVYPACVECFYQEVGESFDAATTEPTHEQNNGVVRTIVETPEKAVDATKTLSL